MKAIACIRHLEDIFADLNDLIDSIDLIYNQGKIDTKQYEEMRASTFDRMTAVYSAIKILEKNL